MKHHCCDRMERALTLNCDQHKDIYDCPDVPISYIPKFDEYGIIVHDGGSSFVQINYCPWCGKHLPESKRVLWFDTLEGMGYFNPGGEKIPGEFLTDEWYKNKGKTVSRKKKC